MAQPSSNIRRRPERASSDLGEARFGFGGVATDEDHMGAGGGEAFGHGAAEFARAADDDGGAAFAGEEIEG